MALFYGVNDTLVAPEEMVLRHEELAALAASGRTATLKFDAGSAFFESEALNLETGFTPVRVNGPLFIHMRHLYTGKYPKKSAFDATKDMLVCSAVKDIAVTNAAPRALNYLRPNVRRNTNLVAPPATDQGTPIIAYYPAVTASSLILTTELVFDEFPEEVFNSVNSAFGSVAQLPIFLPAAGYLLAASTLVKIVGGLGQALFDGEPVFQRTETLDFTIPMGSFAKADFRIFCNSSFDPSGLRFENGHGLVDANGKAYDGDEPYMVIALDGAERENLREFAPSLLSAAQLQKFFNVKSGTQASVEAFVDAMKLLNDSKYRTEADRLKKRIDALKGDPNHDAAALTKLQESYDAQVANIVSEAMKPVTD